MNTLTAEQRLEIIARIMERSGKRAMKMKTYTHAAMRRMDCERIYELARVALPGAVNP